MMASNSRSSIEEQPPPYAEDAHPLENLKEAAVEELPAYAADPPLPSRGEGTQRPSRRRRVYLLLFTALILIVAAIVGGVLGSKHHKNQQVAEANKDPSNPIITALTATECVAGTFVFYQISINGSDIFLHANFWNGYWNGTGSSEIPSMKLDLTDPNLQPMYGSNLTAVAYTTSSKTLDEYIIVLRLYYLSFGHAIDFAIVEATLTLPMYPYTTDSAPNPIPVTQQIVANVSNPCSISACYIEDFGLSLYYLSSPPSSGKPNTAPATLTQLTMNLTAGYDPSTNSPISWNPPLPLNATALNSGAALTAACVNDPANAPTEIHVLYTNQDNVVGQITFANNSWTAASPITDVGGQPFAQEIDNMVATVPSVNPSQLYLYYLLDHRPQLLTIGVAAESHLNTLYTNVGFSSTLPDAIQAPALIAASTRMIDGLDGSEQSLFYVWKFNSTADWGPQGGTIVNFTNGWQGDYEDSWNAVGFTDLKF